MTLNDFRELKSCSLVSGTGLDGGTIKPITRIGDLANKISLGSASVYTSRAIFEEHVPYMKEYDTESVLTIFINYHFLKESRRHLSGDVAEEDSHFSVEEKNFYNEYGQWVFGTAKYGELLQAIEAFDFWLIEDIQFHNHPTVNREYSETHKWRKTIERIE